ncbi:hypothetical protein L0156_23015 [bacterium]|nr:hypothetical protein [bacterium]
MNDSKYKVLVTQQVDLAMNQIIQDMKTWTEKTNFTNQQCELSASQLSNTLGVAAATKSVEVVLGYIEYQIGRDNSRRSWGWSNFGDQLLAQLRALGSTAEGIVSIAAQRSGLTLSDEVKKKKDEEAWMELMRQYLGQMRRYFVYRKKKER